MKNKVEVYQFKKDIGFVKSDISTEAIVKNSDSSNGATTFYHYAPMEFIETTLMNKGFLLGRLDNLNDSFERKACSNPTKTYSLSLSISKNENAAMWGLYGNRQKGTIAYVFEAMNKKELSQNDINSTFFKNVENKKNQNYKLHDNNSFVRINMVDGLKKSKIAYTDFNDLSKERITFKFGKSRLYTDIVGNKKRFSKKNKTIEETFCIDDEILNHMRNVGNGELDGFIKKDGWSYEKEYRYLVQVEKEYSRESKVFLSFEEMGLKLKKIILDPWHDNITGINSIIEGIIESDPDGIRGYKELYATLEVENSNFLYEIKYV